MKTMSTATHAVLFRGVIISADSEKEALEIIKGLMNEHKEMLPLYHQNVIDADLRCGRIASALKYWNEQAAWKIRHGVTEKTEVVVPPVVAKYVLEHEFKNSSVIKGISYDTRTMELTVVLHTGYSYTYQGVSNYVWQNFINAPSAGIYWNNAKNYWNIKDYTETKKPAVMKACACVKKEVKTPWHIFDSTVLAKGNYDPSMMKLVLKLKTGGTYTYKDVPASTWNYLKRAVSAGKYWHTNIKDRYVSTKTAG